LKNIYYISSKSNFIFLPRMCLYLKEHNVYCTFIIFSFKNNACLGHERSHYTQLYCPRGIMNRGEDKKYIRKEIKREKKRRSERGFAIFFCEHAAMYISWNYARVNCIMQISVVPAESSAGGKEIHQNSWLPPVDSGAFSCKRNNRFFQLHFSASSAARIAALGIPGIEWTEAPPRAHSSCILPGKQSFIRRRRACARTRSEMPFLSMYAFLLCHCTEKRSGWDAFIHVSLLLLHRASRHAITGEDHKYFALFSCISHVFRSFASKCLFMFMVKQIWSLYDPPVGSQ